MRHESSRLRQTTAVACGSDSSYGSQLLQFLQALFSPYRSDKVKLMLSKATQRIMIL
jgi:hypothetical protein